MLNELTTSLSSAVYETSSNNIVTKPASPLFAAHFHLEGVSWVRYEEPGSSDVDRLYIASSFTLMFFIRPHPSGPKHQRVFEIHTSTVLNPALIGIRFVVAYFLVGIRTAVWQNHTHKYQSLYHFGHRYAYTHTHNLLNK